MAVTTYSTLAVAEAFYANLFARPKTVASLLACWQQQYRQPLIVDSSARAITAAADTLADADIDTDDDDAAVFGRMVRALCGVLVDVSFVGHSAAVPLVTDTSARPFVMLQFIVATAQGARTLTLDTSFMGDPQFWVSGADLRPVYTSLATMWVDARQYWSSVTDGDMTGHVAARGFLFAGELGQKYFSPAVFIVAQCHQLFAMLAVDYADNDTECARAVAALASKLAPLLKRSAVPWARGVHERDISLVEQLRQLLLGCHLPIHAVDFLDALDALALDVATTRMQPLYTAATSEEQRARLPLGGVPAEAAELVAYLLSPSVQVYVRGHGDDY